MIHIVNLLILICIVLQTLNRVERKQRYMYIPNPESKILTKTTRMHMVNPILIHLSLIRQYCVVLCVYVQFEKALEIL